MNSTVFCTKCGAKHSSEDQFCGGCGASLSEIKVKTVQSEPTDKRKVGILLGIGIFIMPYIFSFFTLRKGHSNFSRVVSFIWTAIIVLPVINNSSNQKDVRSVASNPTNILSKEEIIRNVDLKFSWSKSGFGNVMEANFTFNNKSSVTVKDIEVTCTHFAPSGTRIDRNARTVYESVAPNSKRSVKNFNMGFIHAQANSTSCNITDLAWAK